MGRPFGYAAVAAIATAAGWVAARAADVGGRQVVGALILAWLVQVIAYALLARRLGRGGDATRAWVAGIAARGGALFAAWVVAAVGLASRGAAAAFGLGLTMLIILEAVWLATIRVDFGSNDTRRE